MDAKEAIKNNDLKTVKQLIHNGEKFDKLSWIDWQPLTKEIYDLFKQNDIDIGFGNVMATMDRRIHEELLAEDQTLFYKEEVWRPIVHFEWDDLFDCDWDFSLIKGSKYFAFEVLVKNNPQMAKVLFDKTDEIYVTDITKAINSLEEKGKTLAPQIIELFVLSRMDKFDKNSSLDYNQLVLLYKAGYFTIIEKTGLFQKYQMNGLIEFAKHLLKDKMNIHHLSSPPYKLNEEDSAIFVELLKTEKYDVNEQCMDFTMTFKDSFTKQLFSFTPLSFLKHFVTNKEKTKLITKMLKQSDDLFENQVFTIVDTRGGGGKTVYVAEYYFDTFNSKTHQKIFKEKMTPEKYKELSKRNKELFDTFDSN